MPEGPHVIIAGFGLPGRAVAEVLDARHIPYCVLEQNVETVRRCVKSGVHIVEGDVRDRETLRRAHIDTALALVIAIPDEKAALEATRLARELSSTVKIISRTHYVSTGMEARVRGADAVVVAEQCVAGALSSTVDEILRAAETFQSTTTVAPTTEGAS
jgi:CPA2 family monovalent cation:H+ antiporter-2